MLLGANPIFSISHEAAYLLLIVGLMIVPRMLQRLVIPAPLSSFGLGMAAVALVGSVDNETLALLATLGISSLFLFAGLEIERGEFRASRRPLLGHLAVRSAVLAGMTYAGIRLFGFEWQVATLVGLALLTPSTGFILETLQALGLDEQERYWVRLKAISGELFALLVLFGVLQSGSLEQLAWSSAALLTMLVGLPLLFVALGRYVVPYAPGSEFSLLLMVGVIAASLTYQLGVYYLVGAFMAGFIARLLRVRMPLLASNENLQAIQRFASFFVPFYFFHRGMGVPTGALTVDALILGLQATAVVLPARVGLVWMQRRFIARESRLSSLRVAAALTPTLIFTLVIAGILRERFQISDTLYGALLIYAGLTTMLPALVLRKPVGFDAGLPSMSQAGIEPRAPS